MTKQKYKVISYIETWKNKKTYHVKRHHGKFVSRTQVTKRRETFKGKSVYVWRDKRGRFYKIKAVRKREKKPPLPPPPPPPPKGRYRYDIVIRISYLAKHAGHSRHGEISGKIISSYALSDYQVIHRAIDNQKNRDYWIDYVDPNENVILHIRESRTEDEETTDLRFKDLGG